jgi:hypothetical protein
LSEENTETWELWSYCSAKVRTRGLGDIIGIDYNALFQVAIVLGIEVTPGILKKINAMEMIMREEVRKIGKQH